MIVLSAADVDQEFAASSAQVIDSARVMDPDSTPLKGGARSANLV